MGLCRRKVGGHPSVYVTRTDEFIVEDYVLPASEKLVKLAGKTQKDMNLAGLRRKTLQPRVQQELESLATKTSIALCVATSAPALASGK
jgi:hypothetical protein